MNLTHLHSGYKKTTGRLHTTKSLRCWLLLCSRLMPELNFSLKMKENEWNWMEEPLKINHFKIKGWNFDKKIIENNKLSILKPLKISRIVLTLGTQSTNPK